MDNKFTLFKKALAILVLMSSSFVYAQNATVTVDASVSDGTLPPMGKYNSWRTDLQNAGDLSVIQQQDWEIYRTSGNLADVHNFSTGTYNFSVLYNYLDQASSVSNSLMWILKHNYSRVDNGSLTVQQLVDKQATFLGHYKQRYPGLEWIEAGNEIISEDPVRYYDIYKMTYMVVNAVNAMGHPGPSLKVGGPVDASFNEPRLDDFLDRYVADTDPNKRLDFVSYHQYLFGTSNKTNPARVRTEKGNVQSKLSARGISSNIPLMITETGIFATSTTSADFGGTGNLDDDLMIQQAALAAIHYWYNEGANPQDVYPFHWTLKHKNPRKDQFVDGQQGTPTPYYNMIKMQQLLNADRISATSNQLTSQGVGVYGLATKSSNSVEVMTWNYQFSGTTSYSTTIQVNNLPSAFNGKDIDVKRYHIDRNTSNYRSGTANLELVENTTVSNPGSYSKTITLDANASDLIVLTPSNGTTPPTQLTFEAESLNRNSNSNTSLSGDGLKVNLDATGVGDWMEFTLPNVAQGTYDISVNIVKYGNGGQAQSSIGGSNQGGVFDAYNGSSTPDPFSIGSITFNTTSNKTIRFTVTGKNSGSSGYKIGIDKVVLTPQVSTFPDPNKWYRVENAQYTKWLQGLNTADGAVGSQGCTTFAKNVRVGNTTLGGDKTRWRFVDAGNNTYRLENKEYGYWLQATSVTDPSPENDACTNGAWAVAGVDTNCDGDQTKWRLVNAGAGKYRLENVNFGYWLQATSITDIDDGGGDGGSQIRNVQSSCTGDKTNWSFIEAGTVANARVGLDKNNTEEEPLGLKRANVVLYPNPANELLNVALGNITGGASDLMITDMSGKVLFSERGVIGNKEIDTSTLENGLYLLVIKNAEIHHQIKFLVTH